jgi:TolB-like protein
MRSTIVTAAAFTALAALAAGCNWERPPAQKVIDSYLAEPGDLANVRRIMVLPFHRESGVQADCAIVRDAFVTELQKLRRFEVVPLPTGAGEDLELNQSLSRGRLSTDVIVRLCNRYSLDGIMTGSVTAWRPYTPPHLGLRTQLISVHSGSTVWAVDAIYDANDRTTVSDLRHYHRHNQRDDGNLHGWEINLLAPQKFTAYVAHRFVNTWIEG